jgi:hypothetical protein
MDGIVTLANDRVYDQLVALLNSIEAILGREMPVCVYPYDDNTAQIAALIGTRPQVQLYQDRDSMDRWDAFARNVWDLHPTARQRWSQANSKEVYHRIGTHRRYCAFDAPFDRFIYMDADTLLMGQVEPIFQQLDTVDFVTYDFQYKDPTHVYEVSSKKLTEVFAPKQIETEIFCSGFYGSKKGIFEREKREWLLSQLTEEAEILYAMAPDQTILNYMVMRSQLPYCNLSLALPNAEKTGCCVTSPHFETRDNILYDQGNRLTYIHYIGLSSKLFAQVCQGENIDFPYRDLFLHYRYLHEPENRPNFTNKPKPYNPPTSLATRVFRKLGLK